MKILAYALGAALLTASAAGAQCLPVNCTGDLPLGGCGINDAVCISSTDPGCSTPPASGCSLANCLPPQVTSTRIDVLPTGGGTFEAHLVVEVRAPWNQWASTHAPSGTLNALWFAASPVPAWCAPSLPAVGLCQYNLSDHVETYVRQTGLTCAGAPYSFGSFSVQLQTCAQPCNCQFSARPNCICGPNNTNATWTNVDDLPPFVVTKAALGCPTPPKEACNGDESCPVCKLVGRGGGASAGGGGASAAPPDSGPGATLRYRAGGVGTTGFPGTAAWRTALGRHWSHDHAERIVVDPDVSHVWLLTRFGTFREFSGLASGAGLRAYATRSPSDEYRRLFYDTATGGWQLKDLEGGVQYFLSSGLWDRTVNRNGTTVQASYSGGNLSAVTFPDGRSETYTYQPGGKLAAITEIGVAGAASRTWTYTWSGDDLARIDRPDGTALEVRYDDARFPGYLTRMDVVATDLTRRVETAWEYDAQRNVQKIWRGDPVATGPNAVDLYTLTFDNLVVPTKTTIRDPLGNSTIVTLARDTSNKPMVTKLEGDCPTCGVGPNSQMTYGDAANPLLSTDVTDGRGLHTQYAYNANGRMTSKTEAAGTALARTTTWQYGNASFPGLPTRIDAPSTSGGTALRSTVLTYNGTGDLTTQTIQGAENGSSFSYPTVTTYNSSGQPLTVDPPGRGTADVTGYTYDPARGNLLPLTRTDPLIGATAFIYDALNRRTSVTDVNNVQTVTAYDALNRVTSVTQKGATPAEDLITTYSYNAFGDLFRTVLPRGNVIEYGYDPAGRPLTIERKPDAATHGERTLYTLDAFGHRTKEELQSWNGTAWVTRSSTSYVYSTRCHLDKTVFPDGSVTENTYDCDGNLAQVWDANHPRATNPTPTQTYTYDFLNRLSSVTQPWTGTGGGSAVTSYGYDVQDHLNQVTDAEGNTTTYTYSDRDLMTRQLSPASGTTTYAYDEHGELTTENDARGIVTTRTLDALDRVTAITYPDVSLNTAYTYDNPIVSFSKGRLTRIARPDAVIDYRYDRFGRTLQDGELAYTWDVNGNPATIVYPGSVTAAYTYDYADRPATLRAQRPGRPDQLLVTGAGYLPAGPLSSLALGNGLTETRAFTNRYLPSSITLGPGNLLSWSYTTDSIGNVKAITDTLNAANNRTYSYLDIHYFLTQGNGPWGPRSWTYDKIGNRLTETRGGITDTYTYQLVPSPGTGHSPILSNIQLGAGGTRTYQYGAAGHLTKITSGSDTTSFLNDAAGHLAALERTTPQAGTAFRYDSRGFLTLADASALPFQDGFESGNVCAWSAALGLTATPTCVTPLPPAVHPTYSSEGLLHALQRNAAPDRSLLFHFAGRPVAQLDLTDTTESWKYLTTDHLGTPIAMTSTAGTLLWQGGFEPFGADWSGAGGAGVFLRFPGQWVSSAWQGAAIENLYYNLNRYYDPATGRYTRKDPLGDAERRQDGFWYPRVGIERFSLYTYVDSNPVVFIDPLGLLKFKGCTPERQSQISKAFKEYCSKIQQPGFKNCMCDSPAIPQGLSRICASNDRTIRCQTDRTGYCAGNCAWSIPLGGTIRLCEDAWTPGCGPLGCTLMHEMTHQLGHGGESKPEAVEKCLGCS
jgi:RHS repeat-associated protein